jgi:uncharacterized coiled-coil protein SlyX
MSIFRNFSFSAPDLGAFKIAKFFSTAANKAKSYVPSRITDSAKGAIDLSTAAIASAASGAMQYSKYGKLVSGLEFAKDIGFTISNASSAIDALSKKTDAKWYLLQTAQYASYAALNAFAVYYVDNRYLTAAAIAAPIASYAMGDVIDGITNWISSKTSPYLPIAPIEVLEEKVKVLESRIQQNSKVISIDEHESKIEKLKAEIDALKDEKTALLAANQEYQAELDSKAELEEGEKLKGKGKGKVKASPQDQEIKKLNGHIIKKENEINKLKAQIKDLTQENKNLIRNADNLKRQIDELINEEAKKNPDSDLVIKLRRLIKLCEELGPQVLINYAAGKAPSGADAARRRHKRDSASGQ